MAWSAPRTWVAAAVLTAAQLNTDLRDNMLWLGTRKGFKTSRVAAQAITTATVTAVSFDTENSDTDNFGAVPSTAYTVPTGLDGVYAVTATASFASASIGTTPFARLIVGGVNYDVAINSASSSAQVAFSVVVPLSATNTFALSVFQNSGVSVNVTATLQAYWLFR